MVDTCQASTLFSQVCDLCLNNLFSPRSGQLFAFAFPGFFFFFFLFFFSSVSLDG